MFQAGDMLSRIPTCDGRLTISWEICRLERDSEVSPGTTYSKPVPGNARQNIAPWEDGTQQQGRGPSFTIQPPNSASWNNKQGAQSNPNSSTSWGNQGAHAGGTSGSHGNGRSPPTPQMPSSVFGSFYNESNENLGQVSPGYAPPNGMGFPKDGEDRRPSIASATTVSSTGSKNSISGRARKKLQGFFGDDYKEMVNEHNSRQNSETSSMQSSLPPFAPGGARNRNNSMNDAMMRSGPPSPTSGSRPRTPGPSSEVTPWVYQDDNQVG